MKNMNIQDIIKSKHFNRALIAIGCLAALLAVFSMGMFVGFKKASFSYKWGENYHRNFGGPPQGFMPGFRGKGNFMGRDFINPHGTAGAIIKIEMPALAASEQASSTETAPARPLPAQTAAMLIVKGGDNMEKTVIATAATAIMSNRDKIKIADLKVDDSVVVIGNPNNFGQIEAKLIRVFK